jgi:hypothetical protein
MLIQNPITLQFEDLSVPEWECLKAGYQKDEWKRRPRLHIKFKIGFDVAVSWACCIPQTSTYTLKWLNARYKKECKKGTPEEFSDWIMCIAHFECVHDKEHTLKHCSIAYKTLIDIAKTKEQHANNRKRRGSNRKSRR